MVFLFWVFATCVFCSSGSSSTSSSDSDENNTPPHDCDAIDSTLNSIFSTNLCGDLLLPTDGEIYLTTAQQYASLNPEFSTTPPIIIIPECDADIKLAISYAKQCDFSIVTRSGGHQYSGLSSCSDSCIQINMQQYDQIEIVDENNINVGPAVITKQLFTELDSKDLNIPAGECAFVGLGGHIQTGGFNPRSIRSHGSVVDFIKSFDIILSDGKTYHITKPNNDETDSSSEDAFNDDLFWAVLGGNAGSWGVITNIQLCANKNEDTSMTYHQCLWQYDSDVMRELMVNFAELQESEAYLLEPNVNIIFTIFRADPLVEDVKIIRALCVWTGLDNKPYDATFCDQLFDSALDIALALVCTVVSLPLSEGYLSDDWVLQRPREFPLPYYVSHGVSNFGMTEEAIDQYVSGLDIVMEGPTKGLFISSQVISWGGEASAIFQNDPDSELTSLPGRDALMAITYNLFYADSLNPNARQLAVSTVENLWDELLTTGNFNNGVDQRLHAFTWGNTDIEEVWDLYYSEDTYKRLREIKTNVDSINLFQTPFTIPPHNDGDESDDALFADKRRNVEIMDGENSSKMEFTLDVSEISLINLWGMMAIFVLLNGGLYIYFFAKRY